MLPFRCLPLPSPLGIVAPIRTVNMPAIAGSTQKEKSPTPVTDALNLPEIVQPVSTTAGNSATTGDSCDNAVVERVQPAATRGSELMTPGPSLWCGRADRPMPSPAGPTTPRGRVAQISAISGARRQTVPWLLVH